MVKKLRIQDREWGEWRSGKEKQEEEEEKEEEEKDMPGTGFVRFAIN